MREDLFLPEEYFLEAYDGSRNPRWKKGKN